MGQLLAMKKTAIAFAGLALLFAQVYPAIAQEPAANSATFNVNDGHAGLHLVEKEIKVPAPLAYPQGLDVLEVFYDMPGKHPLALLTHRSAESFQDRQHLTPWSQLEQARWFAQRGYFVMVVVRSGYGRSDGTQDFPEVECDPTIADYADLGFPGTRDLSAVIKFAANLPQVDATTVISAGYAEGGFLQVRFASEPPPGLKATINFSGGVGSSADGHSCNEEVVVDSFRSLGIAARRHGDLPSLWIYAQNDRFYPPYMAKEFDAAYRKGGGGDQLVLVPAIGKDGRDLYLHVSQWSDAAETFLKSRNLLPLGDTVLPIPEPPAIAMPPELKQNDLEMWNRFLLAAPFKTLVADQNGALWMSSAGFYQSIADSDASQQCRKGGSHNTCTIVARSPDLTKPSGGTDPLTQPSH
jgi:dienelactone hydrolase